MGGGLGSVFGCEVLRTVSFVLGGCSAFLIFFVVL